MFLYNEESDRYLREGDSVRVDVGPHEGVVGEVVGFVVGSTEPVLVQLVHEGEQVQESFGANELTYKGATRELPPFPKVADLVGESKTCGNFMCVLAEDGYVYTVIPAEESSVLDEASPIQKGCLVTRLPHLTCGNMEIAGLLESTPDLDGLAEQLLRTS